MDFDELRLVVTHDPTTVGSWQVRIAAAPNNGFVGMKDTLVPVLTTQQLAILRSRDSWPNMPFLQTIGDAVFRSVLGPNVMAALTATLLTSKQGGHGLRIVVVPKDDEVGMPGTTMRIAEMPYEALFNNSQSFFGTNMLTPISRSFLDAPEDDPAPTPLPLRVLVAVAAPTDKPEADMAKEVEAIEKALEDVAGPGGPVELELVQQPTLAELGEALGRKPHIFHFIGHGGFEPGAIQGHLCFIRPGSTESAQVDAETLATLLRNSSVRLVVLTACSSAIPGPPIAGLVDPGPLGTRAFDGVAQRLVKGISGVTAAVAMQFDLESDAAVEFTRAFYGALIKPGLALDEIVTYSRIALVTSLKAGHRAWVNPAVYWRCKQGRVFDIDLTLRRLDEATKKQLQDVESRIAFIRSLIDEADAQPAEVRAAIKSMRRGWIKELRGYEDKRGSLLGESIRLVGDNSAAGEKVTCRLTFRVRQSGVIGQTKALLDYPVDRLSFVNALRGADASGVVASTGDSPGEVTLIMDGPSGGKSWEPGEYELATVAFSVTATALAPSVIDVRLRSAETIRDGQNVMPATADAVVVLDPAP